MDVFLRRQSNIYITYIYNVSWDGFCNVRCNGYSIGWKSLGFSYWAFGRWQFLGMCRSDGCLWWYYKSSDNCLEAGWTGFDGFDLQLCLFMDNCCLLWVKRNFPCFRICVWRLVSCLLLSFCFFSCFEGSWLIAEAFSALFNWFASRLWTTFEFFGK